ncbi:hypothetical protein BESEP4_00016 [Staphylococcus phage vB_SepM_BE04]|nr:hypothetical protein BESEP4_00016 [Staphylococcus phage vB_SepM_BE04]
MKKLYNEIKKETEKLNKQFMNIKKLVEKLDYTDVKLHDVALTLETEEDMYMFNVFCEFELDEFINYLKDNNLEMEHLETTSSFKIVPKSVMTDFELFDVQDNENIFDVLGYGLNELEDVFLSDNFEEYYSNLNDDIEDLQDDLQAEFEELQDSLYYMFKDLKAVRKGYKYITDFKNNQLELFKEFNENN